MEISDLNTTQQQNIYTVSGLNNTVRLLLEETFAYVWVEGEISNFATPNSGHWYFSLKDNDAQVRCAMFKGNQRKVGFKPKDGMHVLFKAKVSLYPNRGDYQLIGEFMEEIGEGKLRRAFEVLKNKLEVAGLFANEHKKPFPTYPSQIGIITSPTGAAVQDILNVLKRRYPFAAVIIYPTLVQGESAAPQIANAINLANKRNECDVLILARGGGSLEDLWPFNEEVVAHAIFNSTLPIISGVGHEVDFTIADFVADERAPTPSAAAELITPDGNELKVLVERYKQQIIRTIQQILVTFNHRLEWTEKHFQQQHPKRKLLEKIQRLDFFELTLVKLQQQQFALLQTRIRHLETKLHRLSPQTYIHTLNNKIALAYEQLQNAMLMRLNKHHSLLGHAASKLDGLSPLATLTRGYAIASHHQRILLKASQVSAGDRIQVKLMSGELECLVERVNTAT